MNYRDMEINYYVVCTKNDYYCFFFPLTIFCDSHLILLTFFLLGFSIKKKKKKKRLNILSYNVERKALNFMFGVLCN